MIYNWENAPLNTLTVEILKRAKHEKKQRDKLEIINLMCAFDIETSKIQWYDGTDLDYHSFMYIWQFQIEDLTVVGRTWEEFSSWVNRLVNLCEECRRANKLDKKPKLIIWVHSLAYEWQYLSGIYPFMKEDAFFMDPRKPFYCKMWGCLEFRCSYRQTNLSLKALCKQYGVEEKLSGQKFDYSKVRFPDTPLTDYELEYCVRDVRSLTAAMKKRMERSGDNLNTIPLTSTGYVRRDCVKALQPNYPIIKGLLPDERQFRLLRRAFRGGNTHSNRNYVGQVLDNVISYDIASSYPTQQLTEKFPMKQFKWLSKHQCTIDRIFNFIGLGYAVVGLYQFKNFSLKNKREPMPYIPLSRAKALLHDNTDNMEDRYKTKVDNGRILECYFCEIALTEVDLEIVLDQYTFDEMAVSEVMIAQKDYLPKEYRDVILGYFKKKTLLKGDDTEEGKYFYGKAKSDLNSIYGMSAQNPCTEDVFYIVNSTDEKDMELKKQGVEYSETNYNYEAADNEEIKKEIEKKLMCAKFPYQWGVYTTAYARAQLHRAIKAAGDTIVYCDTDSIKCLGDVDIKALNEEQKRKAKRAGAVAKDKNGAEHYIGVFENDGMYKQFITQGAKRYAYIDEKGKMGITVAGVTKAVNEKTGVPFAVEELKTLDRFKPGMVWKKAGGTRAVYNDTDDFLYEQDGHQVRVGKNVAIVDTTYEMTYSRDYYLLLKEIELYGEYQRERY